MESNIVSKAKLIYKTIAGDVELQKLYAERARIYTFVVPTIILKEGKEATVWFDETNNLMLSKVNELIEFRIEQIKNFYSK
jgi:hypothetical protein